jgi:hypothetical protein
MFLVFFLEKLYESLHFYMVYKVKKYYSNIQSKNIRIMNNFPKKYSNKYSNNGHPSDTAAFILDGVKNVQI